MYFIIRISFFSCYNLHILVIHIGDDNLYSYIIDTLALLVGIIGLFKEGKSSSKIEIVESCYIPNNIEQQNLETKRRIIQWSLLIIFILSSVYIVYTNFGAVPIISSEQTLLPFFNELNSYLFFTVLTLTKGMSFTIPILVAFVTIKYIFSKTVAYKFLSIFCYGLLFILAITLSLFFNDLNTTTFLSSVTNFNSEIHSLLDFFRIYTGYVSMVQIIIFFWIINHLTQNLLLLENKSVYLKNNLVTILTKIFLPISLFLIILYWTYVL